MLTRRSACVSALIGSSKKLCETCKKTSWTCFVTISGQIQSLPMSLHDHPIGTTPQSHTGTAVSRLEGRRRSWYIGDDSLGSRFSHTTRPHGALVIPPDVSSQIRLILSGSRSHAESLFLARRQGCAIHRLISAEDSTRPFPYSSTLP